MKISHHKFITNTLLLIVFVLLVFPNYLFGQESRRERLNRMHREVLHDPYIPVKRDTMPRSKAYRVDTSFYFTRQVPLKVILGKPVMDILMMVDKRGIFRMC